MKKRAVYVLLAAVLFATLQKVAIECDQHGLTTAGFCLAGAANILKVVFLVLWIAFLVSVIQRHPNIFLRFLTAALFLPLLLVFGVLTAMSGRLILNASRPTRPQVFLRDRTAVSQLTDLASEMIRRQRVTWIGNSRWRFVFDVNYANAQYQFASTFIPKDHDFSKPVDAEDTSKVHHSAVLPGNFRPTDKVRLDPNDYAFCQRASVTIRRIGFNNVMLYPEHNIVQYQIYDFIGWDAGTRYIYYFSPAGNLPEDVSYTRQLNANWYYTREPRFPE
jgi:hypothetical protein